MSTVTTISLVKGTALSPQGLRRRPHAGMPGHPTSTAFPPIDRITDAIDQASPKEAFLLLGYEATAHVSGIAPLRLAELLKDVHAGFSKHRTSADIARAHGLSSGMLRAFRAGTGRTLHEYITAVRVIHGVRALALTDEKVSTIADNVGYRSKKDFYHGLRRHCGLLPKTVRALPAVQRIQLAATIAGQLLVPRRA